MYQLRKYLWTGIFLAMIGWGGIIVVVFLMLPTLGPRWLLFFFLTLALMGTSLPIISYLNLRFTSDPPATGGVVIRQATWVGIYGDLIVWLLPGGVLNLPLALFLIIGFVLIELLLRLRERSQWKPKEPMNG